MNDVSQVMWGGHFCPPPLTLLLFLDYLGKNPKPQSSRRKQQGKSSRKQIKILALLRVLRGFLRDLSG
jgi:hypothetical protein